MLRTLVKKAVRAGGASMPRAKARAMFNHDSRKRSNVLLACNDINMQRAIAAGVIGDHRAIPMVLSLGPIASKIVLELETQLERKLSRERAQALKAAYQRVQLRKRPKAVVIPLWLARNPLKLAA